MFQVVGLIFILFGIVGKIGAIFVTVPYPVVGGMMMINFGVLIGVMLSNLQFIDLTSTRNLGIIGMSMLLAVMFPFWIETTPDAIDTGRYRRLIPLLHKYLCHTLLIALCFQHFPRDLANVNEWKIMFDPSIKCLCNILHCGIMLK